MGQHRTLQLLTPLVLIGAAWGMLAAEPELLTENAGGILQLEGETRLEVVGLHGAIVVRKGRDGEIRFASRRLADSDVEHAVALWLEDSTLRITSIPGGEEHAVRLEVAIPPSLATRVIASDGEVQLTGLHRVVEVRGERLKVGVRSIDGSVDLRLSEGTLKVNNVSEELSLEGKKLVGKIENVSGSVSLTLEESRLEAARILGELDADLEGSELSVTGVAGRARLTAEGGRVELNEAKGGSELELSGTTLALARTVGAVDIESDAEIRFNGHDGPLNIRGRRSDIVGAQSSGGLLDIENYGAEIQLDDLGGSTQVRGDDLTVNINGCKGEIAVSTVASTIAIQRAEKSVQVENEFGDVTVQEASGPVKVVSTDGEVRVLKSKAAVEIDASGAEVEVTWDSLNGVATSLVQNSAGDVRLSLPSGMRARIDAAAPFGRVETDFEDLQVTEDGHEAKGVLLGGTQAAPQVKKPTIRARASANLFLYGAESP